MRYRILVFALVALTCSAAADPVAARLAQEARKLQSSGQIVRAYLLYAEAAARDPGNASYRNNRDALAPAVKLLTQAHIERAPDISADIQAAEKAPPNSEPPVELVSEREWKVDSRLRPIPHLEVGPAKFDFDLRGDQKTVIQQVVSRYGLKATVDADLTKADVHFELAQADFRTAMEALTAVTKTFMFPLSAKEVFFAADTEVKRDQLEPSIVLTFPLPRSLEQKDLIEAANAVRGVLGMRAIGWDSGSRMVMVRDRITRARVARALLETLLLPKGQVSFEVEFITVNKEVTYHYGLSLPTSFRLIDFGHLGGFKSVLSSSLNESFLVFGGGASVVGVGLTDATLFASYSKLFSRVLFDATVVVGDRQTANFHVGDKYPITTTVYSGAHQNGGSIYNPVGEVSMEDLGLVLKLTPRVTGDGSVSIDIEANYKTLGAQVFNTIPAIAEREYKGTITVPEGQWAVVSGIDQNSNTTTRSGLAGIAEISGVNQFLSENNRDTRSENTLIVIKPTITILPMSATISPQYLLGPQRGERVLM